MKIIVLWLTISVLITNYAYALGLSEQSEMLAMHNQARSAVNVPDMKWSASLTKTAQSYANKLAKNGCGLVHSRTNGIGENLYWASPITQTVTSPNGNKQTSVRPQNITASTVVKAWADEKQDYDAETNSCAVGKVCGHYTQLIWKSTTQVGCAKGMCPDSAQIWVCHYAPPGNYIDQKPY